MASSSAWPVTELSRSGMLGVMSGNSLGDPIMNPWVMELVGVTSYGIWTVVGYGILTFVIGLIVFGMNMLFVAMNK